MAQMPTSPRWIAGHVLVVIAVVVMVNLGFWQLRRLDERRDANARVVERSLSRPVAVAELADEPAADVEFRRVTATGTFDAEHEVLVGYRTSRGLPGYHVITPLVLDGGERAVLVNRGFIPLAMADDWPDPPEGEVDVVGLLRRSFDARSDRIDEGDADDDGGAGAPILNNVDVPVIDGYVPQPLLPVHIELQRPAPSGFPDPLPEVDLSEGSHLSYAVQWFLFATVAGVGWVVLVRRWAATVNPRRGHSEADA
jgi:surfeit locus 1 family protein